MASLATLLAPLILLGAQVPDNVGLVRIDPDKKGKHLWITLNAPSLVDGEIVGELRASDRKWENLGGKKPVRFAFGAQWDAADREEIVVVRELKKKKDKRLELLVYRAPDKINGNTGKPVGTTYKKDFGFAVGDGRVVAVGPIDVDGDHRDEVAVVREGLDGALRLDVLSLPTKKKDKAIALVRSDATFGDTATGAVIGLYGTDIDEDGNDELVVLRRDAFGTESLQVVAAPAIVDGETGPPLLSDDDVSPDFGWTTTSFGRLRADLGEVHRPLFIRQQEDGAQRLELFELPATVAGEVGAPLDVDADLDIAGFPSAIVAAFGVRDGIEPPEPHQPYAGGWQVSYRIAYQDQGGQILEEWIGPFTGIMGSSYPNAYLELEFPPGTTFDLDTVEGFVSGWFDTDTAYFKVPGTFYGPTIHFYPKVGSGLLAAGDRITVTYPWGNLHQPDAFSFPWINGHMNDASIGELIEKDTGNLKAVVREYRFDRVP